MVILACLPLCCGVMKRFANIIAILAIVVGVISIFIPLLGGPASASGVVEKACSQCGTCSDEDKDNLHAKMSALGVLVAYIGAWGWLAIVFGR